MVTTSRARLAALCAMLSLSPLGGTLADPAIKPALIGLISTGIPVAQSSTATADDTLALFKNTAGQDLTGIFGGLVIQVAWADLEPTQPPVNGPVTLNTQIIETALSAVSTYNAKVANNRRIGVRLRVFAGCSSGKSDAPAWAMSPANGGSVTISAYYSKTADGKPDYEACTTGRFWDPTSGYAAAWRQFQTALAAQYDSNAMIQEVAVTSCTSFSAEPFFLPYTHKIDAKMPKLDTTTMVLTAANYNVASYQQCLEDAVEDYAAWQTTRLEFTFNPFSGVFSTPNDVAFSERVMRGCRQTAPQRCILSNHDLDTDPPSASTILPIYALERKFGPDITFQTYIKTPSDFEGTIRKGISLGAGAIEVWPDGYKAQSKTTLASWASMFEPQ
jgi:hypothetical protein